MPQPINMKETNSQDSLHSGKDVNKPILESVIEDFEERLSNETDFRGYLIRPEFVPIIKSYIIEKLQMIQSEERKQCVEIVESKRKEAENILKERPTNWSAIGAATACIDIKNTINTK